MIRIIKANANHVEAIRNIAERTWLIAYKEIISTSQIDYMLKMMYSKEALLEQLNVKNHQFVFAKKDEELLGFASYEFASGLMGKTKIHKLYILPEAQGNRIGEKLVQYICKHSKENNQTGLFLNVNKNNKALIFYQKMGFDIVKEEIIDIGNGFVMDDYVMEKLINKKLKQ